MPGQSVAKSCQKANRGKMLWRKKRRGPFASGTQPPPAQTRKPPGRPETLVFLCSGTAALSERRFPALLAVPSGPFPRKAGSVPILEDEKQINKFNGL